MAAPHRLAIAEDLTIYHALDLKQTLCSAIKKHKALELDLSHVGEIDTAGLQLLIYAKREAARANKEISITAHSKAVQECIDFCNLATYFGDPVVITAHEHH